MLLTKTVMPTSLTVPLIQPLRTGTDCLRAYIRGSAERVQGWSDGTTTGQDLMLEVFRRQLDPSFPETALDDVGKTITQ